MQRRQATVDVAIGARVIALTASLAVAACGATDRGPVGQAQAEESRHERPRPPDAPRLGGAPPSTSCRWIVPAPEPLGVTAIVARDEANVVALAARGRAYRLVRDRWEPLAATERAPRPGRVARVQLPPGAPITPVQSARAPDGAVFLLDAAGAMAVWRSSRRVLRERDGPGHASGFFEEQGGAGWRRVTGAAPPDPVALVAMASGALVAGRAGELVHVTHSAMLDQEIARPLVHSDARRVLRLVVLRDGSLLVVRRDALLRAPRTGTPGAVAVDAAWLDALDARSAAPLLAAPIGGDGALVVQHSDARLVAGARATRLDLSHGAGGRALNEVMGLAPAGGSRWVAITLNGAILAGDGASWRVLATIQRLDGPQAPTPVADPIGAFTGAQGVVRVADRHRRLGCVDVTAGTLTACGEVPDVEPMGTHAIDDALVVQTQHIGTAIVSSTGVREVPIVLGFAGIFAGTAAAPIAIAERTPREILALRDGAWTTVVALPSGLTPAALARSGGEAIVGGADGSVAACRLR